MKRFYSMPKQIRQEPKEYYDLLEHTQKGETLRRTGWLTWFLNASAVRLTARKRCWQAS